MAQPVDPQHSKPEELPRPSESLEDLARKQGINPVQDLDAIAMKWPADDDPDAFDAFIREQRSARRSVARGIP